MLVAAMGAKADIRIGLFDCQLSPQLRTSLTLAIARMARVLNGWKWV